MWPERSASQEWVGDQLGGALALDSLLQCSGSETGWGSSLTPRPRDCRVVAIAGWTQTAWLWGLGSCGGLLAMVRPLGREGSGPALALL